MTSGRQRLIVALTIAVGLHAVVFIAARRTWRAMREMVAVEVALPKSVKIRLFDGKKDAAEAARAAEAKADGDVKRKAEVPTPSRATPLQKQSGAAAPRPGTRSVTDDTARVDTDYGALLPNASWHAGIEAGEDNAQASTGKPPVQRLHQSAAYVAPIRNKDP